MDTQNAAPVAAWFAERLYWVFIGVMLLNIIQRRHQPRAERKRMATLYIGIGLFLLFAVAHSINEFGGADWMFYLIAAAFVAGIYYYREKAFPFRVRSAVDGRWLNFDEIFFDDNHGDHAETFRNSETIEDESEDQ